MQSSLVTASRLSGGTFAKLSAGQRTNSDMGHGTSALTKGVVVGARRLVNPSWTDGEFPMSGSTIDLDFINNKGYFNSTGIGGVMDFLTFTRASIGTYFGADGLLKTTPTASLPQAYQTTTTAPIAPNLLTYSNTFTNATVWSPSGLASTTGGVTDPLSGSTATNIIENNVNTTHVLSTAIAQSIGAGWYTFSCYAKNAGENFVELYAYYPSGLVNCGANFNLTTGEVTATGNYVGTVNIPISQSTNAGNGWWRCSITFYVATGGTGFSNRIYIQRTGLASNLNNQPFLGDGVSGISLWQAQLEQAPEPTKPYRFDYSNQQYYGNLIVNSQTIGASPWSLGALVPTQGQSDPFGGTGATLLTTNAAGSNGQTNQGFGGSQVYVNLNQPYTYSIYLKAGTATWACLQVNLRSTQPTANCYQWFNLATGQKGGTTGSSVVPFDATISADLGGGWYRCTITRYMTINKLLDLTHQVNCYAFLCTANNSVASASGATMYAFAPQFESGTSATTYKSNVQQTFSLPVGATATMNGFLSEPPSTNYVLWCRDATNAAWTNTGITPLLNQTGIDGVANSASQLTATTANATSIQSFTQASAGKISSVYLKRISGTGAIQITVDGTNWNTINLENGLWNRGIVTAQTVTNPIFGIRITTSGDVIAMDYAQLENAPAGTMASSPIYTASATVTRATDIFSRVDLSPYNGQQGTIFYKGIYYTNGSIGSGKSMNNITSSKSGDAIGTFTYTSTTGSSGGQKGSGRARPIPYGVNSYNGPNIPTCIGLSYNNNKLNTCSDGGVNPSGIPAGTNYQCNFENVDGSPFLNLDTINNGGGGSGEFIQRITYFPRYTPMEGLAELTRNPQLQINGF